MVGRTEDGDQFAVLVVTENVPAYRYWSIPLLTHVRLDQGFSKLFVVVQRVLLAVAIFTATRGQPHYVRARGETQSLNRNPRPLSTEASNPPDFWILSEHVNLSRILCSGSNILAFYYYYEADSMLHVWAIAT